MCKEHENEAQGGTKIQVVIGWIYVILSIMSYDNME